MIEIYKVTNLINDKIYIGQHKPKPKYDYYLGSGKLIRQAVKKYGKSNFTKEIIYRVSSPFLADFLEKMEIKKAKANGRCYNLMDGGQQNRKWVTEHHPNKGRVHSEEENKATSDGLKLYYSTHNHSMKGKHISDIARKHMSESLKEFWKTHDWYDIYAASLKSRNEKISKSKRGRTVSNETRMKISNTLKGRSGVGKKVICIENGVICDTISEARRRFGGNVYKSIHYGYCANGLHWEFINE